MAKALMGHFASVDAGTAAELAALRRRVRDLESEVAELRTRLQEHTLDRLDGELAGLDALDAEPEPTTITV